MTITWHGITLAPDDDGVYRPTAPVGFPVSLEEGEECWLAAVGGGQRRHEGATPEEALDYAAAVTIGRATLEIERWRELRQKLWDVADAEEGDR